MAEWLTRWAEGPVLSGSQVRILSSAPPNAPSSRQAWLELESARLKLEVETRLWEVENEVFSPEAGCYDWEFIDEWV